MVHDFAAQMLTGFSDPIYSWSSCSGEPSLPISSDDSVLYSKSHSNNLSLSHPINTRISWYMAFKMFGLPAGLGCDGLVFRVWR
jgi:hypothetical protein